MDFPDIKSSWKAFKFSWLRRMMTAKRAWVEILKDSLRPRLIFQNIQASIANLDLIQLSKNTKYICNAFWREIFKSVPEMMTKYTTKWSHMRPYTSIRGSTTVKNENDDPLEQNQFSPEARKIQYVVDMVKMSDDGTISEKSTDELEQEYQVNQNDNKSEATEKEIILASLSDDIDSN